MTTAGYEQVLHLVNLIYEAATQPDLWPDFLKKLCVTIPASACNINVTDVTTGITHLSVAPYPAEVMQVYFERYHQINPYFIRDLPHMRTGRIFKSHETCPPNEFEQTEFYQGFFRPLNLFHGLFVTVLKEGEIAGNLALARSKDTGIYTDEEVHLLDLLVPHLQRAFRIGNILEGLRLEREMLSLVLAKLTHGAMIVSLTGHLIFANPSAEQILGRKDGLIINRQRNLEATSLSAHKQLRQMVESAGQPASLLPAQCGGLFQLERPSGLRPFSLLIAPLSLEISHYNFHQPSVLIFITDPEQQTEVAEDRLRQLYSLTPAEARLAVILMRGTNIIEAAAELQVSQNTARTHLKRVFQKTGTHRQSELVNILFSSGVTIK